MFRPPISNPALKRTIRPIYAQHQATTYGGFLDPNWNRSFDILPGTFLMCRLTKEIFTPFTGSAGQTPFGVSRLCSSRPAWEWTRSPPPERTLFTVWVGGPQAVFEILKPAFDSTANWASANVTNGATALLKPLSTNGLLTTGGTGANCIAELIDVPTTDKLLIRMRYPA